MRERAIPTGREAHFGPQELIVTKTDTKGRIMYANEVFLRVAGYTEPEVLGVAHSLIRHPDMPRVVFHLLWKTIQTGSEIFAYVKNMARNGDHYWVLAHVTPSYDRDGVLVGYHSNRRKPHPRSIAAIEPVYEALLREERRHSDLRQGIAAAEKLLMAELDQKGLTYPELVFALWEDSV